MRGCSLPVPDARAPAEAPSAPANSWRTPRWRQDAAGCVQRRRGGKRARSALTCAGGEELQPKCRRSLRPAPVHLCVGEVQQHACKGDEEASVLCVIGADLCWGEELQPKCRRSLRPAHVHLCVGEVQQHACKGDEEASVSCVIGADLCRGEELRPKLGSIFFFFLHFSGRAASPRAAPQGEWPLSTAQPQRPPKRVLAVSQLLEWASAAVLWRTAIAWPRAAVPRRLQSRARGHLG